MKMKSTQVYLTEAEYAALQQAADRAGASMTAVIRDLIERHLIGGCASDRSHRPGWYRCHRATD